MTQPSVVSVVLPTHNRSRLLAAALTSVADQTYRPLEVVVVDDGSTDDTAAVLERGQLELAERGVSVRCERLPGNAGPASARNAGVKLASGPMVAFLDSDDLWRPEFVATLVGLLERHPHCGLAFSGAIGIDANGGLIAKHESGLPVEPGEGALERPFELVMRKMPFLTPAVLVRRDVLEAAVADGVGPFDESLRLVSDWDLWYRLAKQVDFAYTLEPLVSNRHHRGNLGKNRAAALGHLIRVTMTHVGDVTDPETRAIVVERVQWTQTLLQEQLLREGRRGDEFGDLLENELAPKSFRYRLGRRLRGRPAWLGRSYAGAVRSAGNVRRRAESA